MFEKQETLTGLNCSLCFYFTCVPKRRILAQSEADCRQDNLNKGGRTAVLNSRWFTLRPASVKKWTLWISVQQSTMKTAKTARDVISSVVAKPHVQHLNAVVADLRDYNSLLHFQLSKVCPSIFSHFYCNNITVLKHHHVIQFRVVEVLVIHVPSWLVLHTLDKQPCTHLLNLEIPGKCEITY